jgi:hypothetical protein
MKMMFVVAPSGAGPLPIFWVLDTEGDYNMPLLKEFYRCLWDGTL